MCDEVLTLASLEAGAIVPAQTPVSTHAVVEEACVLVKPAADAKGVGMRAELPELDAMLVSHPPRVRQILVNLLTNAVKYTEHGEIVVRAAVSGASVRFVVTDTGIGIPPESTAQIFDPFWQAESTRTRKVGGVGLGLSLALQLARALGGTLELTSTSPSGSVFTLSLPLAGVHTV